MSEPIILEAEHFRTEQATLMQDPLIIDMAGGLLYDPNAPKGQALLDWLDSYEGMIAAKDRATAIGVRFQSIGGPARAIRALIMEAQQ